MAEKEYTFSSEKECIKKECSITLYSGIRFVQEDGYWKKVEHARSLKDKYGFEIKYEEIDERYPMNVVDFNSTSITLEFDKWSFFNTNIPLKFYDGKKVKDDKIKKEFIETINIFDFGNKKKTYSYELGDAIKFGDNSTIVILQDADTENLDDTFIYQNSPTTNFGSETSIRVSVDNGNDIFYHSLLKFNISDLESDSVINSANLELNILSNGLDTGSEGYNISTHHIYQSYGNWDESVVTWNNQPTINTQYNSTFTDTIRFTNTLTGWQLWNVTNIINADKGNPYSSIFLRGSDEYGNPSVSQDYIWFNSKEHGTTAVRPKLTINYSAGPDTCNSTTGPWDCLDDCIIGGFDLGNNDFKVYNTGSITINSSITSIKDIIISDGCNMIINDGVILS